MQYQTKKNFSQYDETVLEFINSEGYFATYTPDQNFINLLFRMVNKHFAVQKQCIKNFHSQEEVLKFLKSFKKNRPKIVLYVERMYEGRSSQDFVKNIKATFEDVLVIVLTSEVAKEVLVSLYESGADNFITKPMSMNTLIEKVAFTLRPQSKIGKLIDNARHLMAQEKLDQAMKAVEDVLEIKPNSAAAFMLRGDINKKMGQSAEAVQDYNKAHKSSVKFLAPLQKLADFYSDSEEPGKELKYLSKMDKLSPLNLDRKVKVGTLNVRLGKSEVGKKYFEEAMKIATKQARDAISELAVKIADRLMSVDSGLAEEYYRKAIKAKGDLVDIGDVETFNRLGICLRQRKEPIKAIQEYYKALKISPKNERLIYNLAMAYMEAGDLEQSRSALSKLFETAPGFYKENEVVCYNIGMVYAYSKEIEKALQYFKMALRIEPDYQPAQKMLSRLNKGARQ